jgi:hypothetical protein
MRPWLQDRDGDGTYTWATSELEAGEYTFKIAEDFAADDAAWYPRGANNEVPVTVPSAGLVVRVLYTAATHTVWAEVTRPNVEPSLDQIKGMFLSPDIIAWPEADLKTDPALLEFRLYWGRTGSLDVDAEAITGGTSVRLRYDPRGVPSGAVVSNPQLEGYIALRLDRKTVRKLATITSGDVAVGVFSGTRLVDAGRVDVTRVK